MEPTGQNPISAAIAQRCEYIHAIPCFAALTPTQREQLARLLVEVKYELNDKIVIENEAVDSVYIIVSGVAEVIKEVHHRVKVAQVPVALLHSGEGIGLSATGFYSTTGKRTATVVAMSKVTALKLDIQDLHYFLQKYGLEPTMYAAATQMLRMRFIKQMLPFSKLSHERLQWLAAQVEEEVMPANTVIFHQGDVGGKCYFIRTGLVEIVTKDENKVDKRLALLKPPTLFGEATLLTHSTRNATAVTLEQTELLTLKHEYLADLIESESNVAKVFMSLMVDRGRPIQNEHVSIHTRITSEGEEIYILKNPDTSTYFKLSAEGKFIWNQLNGKHTLQEITLSLANHLKVFAPDVVVALISKLTRGGFISNLELYDIEDKHASIFKRTVTKMQRLLEFRLSFKDADVWVSRIYNRYVKYLFTQPGLYLLSLTAIIGFLGFVTITPDVILFFSYKHASLLLLLGLFPLSLFAVILHELGHVFTVKAFGREVHYIGIGWFWLMPMAFTDTSDMWLAARKQRILVNLAGVYVDVIVAGIIGIIGYFLKNYPYLQCMLWLFALYTYIGAFRMLNPLQELDGYYVLMDYVEKNHLRRLAISWLVKGLPKAIRHPKLFREHKAEVIYWLACILFLILISLLTLLVQEFVVNIFGLTISNHYVALILPLLAAILSSISIIIDIRKTEE